jgi:heme exporter protein C
MWFSMIILLLFSLIASIKTLSGKQPHQDIVAAELAKVGTFMGILGVLTGSLWARFTWGDWWVSDAKLNGAAITLLFYFAYLILRASIEDPEKKARIAAVYNIFAYVMLIVFLMVLPRMTDSLHPGNGGNPGFGGYDLDNTMKIVFYPAILGWTLLGAWLANLGIRYQKLKNEMEQSF